MLLFFFAIWIVLNGKITLEIAIFGLVISVVMFLFICKFMDYSIKKEIALFKNIFAVIGYIILLIVEIIKANISAAKLIFSARYELEPVLVTFRSPLKSSFLNVVLANSITLTPGTITVSMEDNVFVVHCLDKELAKDIDCSSFVKKLEAIERRNHHE